MFAKRLLGFTHVQRLALSNRLATVLRRLLGSFYIAVILYAAVFVSSPQFFTTNGLGRYVSKRLASLRDSLNRSSVESTSCASRQR